MVPPEPDKACQAWRFLIGVCVGVVVVVVVMKMMMVMVIVVKVTVVVRVMVMVMMEVMTRVGDPPRADFMLSTPLVP